MNPTKETRKIKFRAKLDRALGPTPLHLWLTEKLEVMAFVQKGKVRVIASLCPHMGAQLQFHQADGSVRCPWHGLTFEAENLKSEHHRYRKICEYEGEVSEGELIIYG